MTGPPNEALVDPLGTVVTLVTAVDPAFDPDTIRRVVEQVGGGRANVAAWPPHWPQIRPC